MADFDGKAFGEEIVSVVTAFMERSLQPIVVKLAVLEERIAALPAPKDGEPGKSVTVDDVAPMIRAEVQRVADEATATVKRLVDEAVGSIPLPKDGRDADPEAVRRMVDEAVTALPPAKDGRDVDMAEVTRLVGAEVERAVAALPRPQDGKSVAVEDLVPLVREETDRVVRALREKIMEQLSPSVSEAVTRAVADLPPPEPGKSVTVEDVRPLVEEHVQKAVSAIPHPKNGEPGKDGVGLAGALIDRSGFLVVTLTDGTTRDLGPVVGKDGTDGQRGADGLGFESMTEELADDGRTLVRRYARGDQVKEFRHSIAVLLDRGVFKEGQTYQAGDGVTWAGSFWIAQEETSEKPDGGKGWRLAVKRGRDGKDGVVKSADEPKPVRIR